MNPIFFVLIALCLVLITYFIIKRKNSNSNNNTSIDDSKDILEFELSIIDFLQNDFKPSTRGIKATILTLFKKDILYIEKKMVNLGTPWEPNEQEIIQLSLTSNANPDNLSRTEDFIIRWLIFTYGDGVHANITKVLEDLEEEEFISANEEMYKGWKIAVLKTASEDNVYLDKPLPLGLEQKKLYENKEVDYGVKDIKNEETKSLLSIFDLSLQ